MVDRTDPVDVLARTLYGEIRGGDAMAIARVGSVIRNRVHHPRWWGKDWIGVCLAHLQFSCWWIDDANRRAMYAADFNDDAFRLCHAFALDFVKGNPVDISEGADSYYAHSLLIPPRWTARAKHTVDDEWHSFWAVELADVEYAADPGAPTHGAMVLDVKAHYAQVAEHFALRQTRQTNLGTSS